MPPKRYCRLVSRFRAWQEAFSIIGQGRVEEILSSKPEERRTIFEEAAGVLKYKLRKKKAETKLAETQDNLQRVNDILHELGQQLEPLRMQASIAKEYLEKREELERFEVALMVHDIEQLHRQWSELNEALNEHQQEEGRLAAELQKTEAHIEQLRDQITAIDESVDGLQQVLLLASEELEKLEGRKEVLKERKKHASQRIEQLDETVIALTEKRRRLTEQLRSEKAALTQLEAGAAALEKELKEQQALLSAHEVDIEEEIERRKGDYIDLVHEQAALKNERLHVEQAIHKLRAKQAALNEANSDHLKQRNQLEQQRAALLAELSVWNRRSPKRAANWQLSNRRSKNNKWSSNRKRRRFIRHANIGNKQKRASSGLRRCNTSMPAFSKE